MLGQPGNKKLHIFSEPTHEIPCKNDLKNELQKQDQGVRHNGLLISMCFILGLVNKSSHEKKITFMWLHKGLYF